ncbi:DUF169 domain-containing protein [Dendrosporobacter sp. 1207_IL3150]|uniref:DUF169 domain-containing protein n=1 Tax=Dendrosporobacter sp. 1207_IL3150 TaxID=3084054 RepID=UPI002FDA9DCF
MNSRLASELKLRYSPIAILFSDEKPMESLQFQEGKRGCVIAMLTAAAKGRTAVFDRSTSGCLGGAVGLGFGNAYPHFPGGIEYFLSTGRGEGYPEGEAYIKTPELGSDFADNLPYTDLPFKYVIFKPLSLVDLSNEKPELITIYANPDQLSALVVLANYDRPGNDNAIIPFGAGCQSICLMPHHESKQARPRAVVGMIDITARPMVDADILSFTVPYTMFLSMEENIPDSFLEKHDWLKVRKRIPDPQ